MSDTELLDWLESHKELMFCFSWNPQTRNWIICNNPTDSYSGAEIIGEGCTARETIESASKYEPGA